MPHPDRDHDCLMFLLLLPAGGCASCCDCCHAMQLLCSSEYERLDVARTAFDADRTVW